MSEPMSSASQLGATERAKRTPEEIFAHHAQALGAEDLDAILTDYADDACIITPSGVTRGKDGTRSLRRSPPNGSQGDVGSKDNLRG